MTEGDAQFPQQRPLLSGQLGGFNIALLHQGDRLDGALLQKYLTFDAKQLRNIPDLTIAAVAGSGHRLVYCRQGSIELVEAVLTPNPFGERVPDELYARATAHYDDRALWTLTLAISLISFFIPVALVGKPIPGMPPGRNYSR